MNRSRFFIPLVICFALLLSACSASTVTTVPTPAQAVTTAAPAVPSATSPAAETPTAAATSTTAASATATSAAAALPTTAATTPAAAAAASPTPGTATAPQAVAAGNAPVITAANLANLTAAPLTLPEWPGRLLWPGPNVPLPAGLSPAPNLLVESAPNLYPIQLDPPAFGKPVPLPIAGRVLAYAPDLSSVAVAPDNGPLTLYSLDGKVLRALDEPAPYAASYSPDGKTIAVASSSEISATLYDVASGTKIGKLTGFETAAPVYSVDFVPGGQMVYWHARATLQFQDIKTGQMGTQFSFQDFITQIAFTPDGTRMFLNVEGKLIAYSLPDGKQLAQVTLSQPMTSLAVSPDGKLIAAGYGAGLQFWDAAALAPLATLPGPNTFTGAVSFSPDGKYLVSIHENNIVQIWKAR